MAAEFDTTEMQSNIQNAGRSFLEAAVAAHKRALDGILAEADPEVPTDTGTLRASGRTRQQVEGRVIRGVVGYGAGQAAGYAEIVHENTHDRHDDGGPKFLERPLIRARATVGAEIAADIRGRAG